MNSLMPFLGILVIQVKSSLCLIAYTKMNSTCVKNVYVSGKTINLRRWYRKLSALLPGREEFLKEDAQSKAKKKKKRL